MFWLSTQAIKAGNRDQRNGQRFNLRCGNPEPSMTAVGQSRRFDGRPITSALSQIADIFRAGRNVSKVPIVLKKSFWGDDQNFSGPLMRFARGDMRDHIVSHRNDHGASYGRYAVLQWWSRLKISFCEIFGVVRFSTFATLSARSRHQEGAGIRPRSETANAISSKPASENQIIAYRMCWLRECERCRTSSSRSCNALDRRRQGAPGRAASPSQMGR